MRERRVGGGEGRGHTGGTTKEVKERSTEEEGGRRSGEGRSPKGLQESGSEESPGNGASYITLDAAVLASRL